MPLTDVKCRTAKPKAKPFKLSDEGWLYLQVQPNGTKLWRMGYRFKGKEKQLSLGHYPKVGLADARRLRDEAKDALLADRDPALKRPVEGESFQTVAEEWLNLQDSGWTMAYTSRVKARLKADIYSQFGADPIASIEAPTILKALKLVEDRGSLEIAKRLRQTVGQIFRYAISTSRAKRDPSADLRDALKPSKRTRHMAKLKEGEIPDFFKALRSYDGEERTRLAIELVMHTFVRTNELLGAKWGEIEGDTWRIPAVRMKMGREHLVPLTGESLRILDALKAVSTDDFVARMSNNTMIYALYRMGYHSRATIHGMRGTASTLLNESGLWSPDAIEKQLAHDEGDSVRAAYNSAQYLPERRRMMEWWSDRLQTLGSG